MAQTIPRRGLRQLTPSIGILSALCLTAYLATAAPEAQADASPAPPHSYVPTGTNGQTLDPEVVNAMDQVAYQYNLPRWWIYAVVAKESSFDPKAVNDWDWYSGTKWEGSGLTQLTTEKYVGRPYPMDLNTCNNNHKGWQEDMGLNQPYLGDWIDMCQVSVLGKDNPVNKFASDRFDPYKNLERFATGHAVLFYHFLKKKHPDASIYELLRRSAYHWNKGLPYFGDSYKPNNWDYLTGPFGYDHWVAKYRPPVEAEDGVWDGKPRLSPPTATLLLEAYFDSGADGFAYIDDAFRSTGNPGYASGSRIASGGFSGGALKVELGGIDNTTVLGTSGGWRRPFSLATPTFVTLSFRYKLTQAAGYESDEFSQLLLSLDGKLIGTSGKDYLAQLTGNGNSGSEESTGWQSLALNLGTLAKGEHILTIGGYNNKKTSFDEVTAVLVDDVWLDAPEASQPPDNQPPVVKAGDNQTVTLASPATAYLDGTVSDDGLPNPPKKVTTTWSKVSGPGTVTFGNASAVDTTATFLESGNYLLRLEATDGQSAASDDITVIVKPTNPGLAPLLQANFDLGADGFAYQDDSFRSTSKPAYASGSWVASGGFSGGALQVTLGGIDNATVLGMSGGLPRPFSLSTPTVVTLSFRYKLTQAAGYESDEFSQLLLSLDGKLIGTGGKDYLAQLTGNGNGGSAESTGWQSLALDLGTLGAGEHKLVLGAYNNKKTFADEVTDLLIDEVVLSGSTASPSLGHILYDDKLYWNDWSWGTIVNLDATSPLFAGAKSLAVTYNAGWAGFSLYTSGLNTSPYSQLKFALHPNGKPLPNVNVSLYNTAGQVIKQVKLSTYASAAGNGWYSVAIPLADLGGAKTTITRVQLQDASGKAQPTFHLDDLKLTP